MTSLIVLQEVWSKIFHSLFLPIFLPFSLALSLFPLSLCLSDCLSLALSLSLSLSLFSLYINFDFFFECFLNFFILFLFVSFLHCYRRFLFFNNLPLLESILNLEIFISRLVRVKIIRNLGSERFVRSSTSSSWFPLCEHLSTFQKILKLVNKKIPHKISRISRENKYNLTVNWIDGK